MRSIKKMMLDCTEKIYISIENQLRRTDRDVIVNANGSFRQGHEGAKKGSFIYLLYDESNVLLYVGETGTSIKKRLIADGSGAHYVTNRVMFDETKYVKYLKTEGEDALSPMERKMIEQALTSYLKPRYYNKKIWEY